MSEGAEWELKIIREDGGLGPNLIDEGEKLAWERITDPTILENSLIVLIYSSGTTGLPKGKPHSIRTYCTVKVADTTRRQTLAYQPRR